MPLPNCFAATMMSHSVIVRRDDRPGRSHAISFSGDAWLDYVPVRVPDTLCVQERLPPGAAAVLINRAHTDTDIYLPIDAAGETPGRCHRRGTQHR